VVFARDAHATLLKKALPRPSEIVRSTDELRDAVKAGGVVLFVSHDRLAQLDPELRALPVVAILDGQPRGEGVRLAVDLLAQHRWLAHIMFTASLTQTRAPVHLASLLERLAEESDDLLLGSLGIGRTAWLATPSRRMARFERMRQFFASHDVPTRAMPLIEEVAEELVMNALYDAPAEAGFFAPRDRTEDFELPVDRACEISYGVADGLAFVRLRDPFGALSRQRIVESLRRCAGKNVTPDVSRGGAGMGLWRVFTAACIVSITVVPRRLTEMLVGIALHGKSADRQLQAVHMFFSPHADDLAFAPDRGLLEDSITFTRVA
jgi:hypothetical protein